MNTTLESLKDYIAPSDGTVHLRGKKWKEVLEEVISNERSQEILGPFERQFAIERAPERVRRLLILARDHPHLIGGNTPFMTAEAQPVAPPTSFTAVNTTNVETNLWVPGIWTPIGANSMYAGKVYFAKAGGVLGTSSVAPTATWTPRVGQSATPSSNITLGATTGTTMIASLAAVPWYWDMVMAIRSLGLAASGATATGNGNIVIGGLTTAAGIVQSMGGAVPTTIDNTAATGLILSLTWGTNAATNTAQAQWTAPVMSLN